MRKHRLIAAALIAPALAAGAATGAVAAGQDATALGGDASPVYTEQQLARNGAGGFPNYRIPALTVTRAGTLLAGYDGRPTGIDAPGPNSILQRRSTDNGATWGPQTAVARGRSTAPVVGYSDPSYVVDRQTGTVFDFHAKSFDVGFSGSRPGTDPADRKVLHAAVSVSTDDGRTYRTRVITAEITPDVAVRSRFAASGQGIQLRYGPHAGRLIQQFTIIAPDGSFRAVSVYSDDHGATWRAGTPVGTGMDENKTVELSDGRVMLNSRDSAGSHYRKVAYSTDGGVTYGPVTLDTELPDPTNNASIIRAFPDAPQGSPEAKVLLFSNAASTTSRSNGTVRASCDDGRTWPVARQFRAGSMSYSTMTNLPDGTVGLLYEPGDGITFARFNLAWLKGVCAPIEAAAGPTVPRGTTATTSVTVTNQLGPTLQIASLAAQAPAGWRVTLGTRPQRLDQGRSATVPVTVAVPASATGGTYEVPVVLTDTAGRTSRGTLTVTVPTRPGEPDGRVSVSVEQVGPQTSYAVGDRLTFGYRVTNLTGATTTVVPSGNLEDLDPARATRSCRYRNLGGHASYTCPWPYHVLTQADLDAGSFTPRTRWVSTSGRDVTTTVADGPTVSLR